MNKETTILFILFTLLLLVGGVIFYAKHRDQERFFIYHGTNGDYRIELFVNGNQTDYYVYALSQETLYRIPLRKSPKDVENIPLEQGLLKKIQRPEGTQHVYLTEDYDTPNKTGQLSLISLIDIGKILGNAEYGIYKLNVQGALTTSTEHSLELEVPKITCSNVNSTTAVIYLTLGETNKIYSQDDCIIVEGKDAEGITLAANKLAYYLLGVF